MGRGLFPSPPEPFLLPGREKGRPRSVGWRLTLLIQFASRKNIVLFYFFFPPYFESKFLCTSCAACLWLVLESSLASAPEELMQGCSGC